MIKILYYLNGSILTFPIGILTYYIVTKRLLGDGTDIDWAMGMFLFMILVKVMHPILLTMYYGIYNIRGSRKREVIITEILIVGALVLSASIYIIAPNIVYIYSLYCIEMLLTYVSTKYIER